jgi:hypothetical protein
MLSQGSIGMKIDRNQSAETTSLGSEPNSSSYRNTAQRFSPGRLMLSICLSEDGVGQAFADIRVVLEFDLQE